MAGLLGKKKNREPEIPTSSMADIAFLLLIFFLVTTTIDVDTGIGMVLPPKLDENIDPPPVKERNMLKILVNEQGLVLMDDRPSAVNQVREEVRKHVLNCYANAGLDCVSNRSEAPGKAVVSIKTARQTPYNVYINVLDEVWMSYFEMWDAEARRIGYRNYEDYVDRKPAEEENRIRELIKANISIAEPDAA